MGCGWQNPQQAGSGDDYLSHEIRVVDVALQFFKHNLLRGGG